MVAVPLLRGVRRLHGNPRTHRAGGRSGARKSVAAGHKIELLGFTSNEPASVILIGEDGRHITLHVIRPDSGEQVARQALQQARVPADADVAPASRSAVARSVADIAGKLARYEGLDDEARTAQIRGRCEQAAQQFVDAPVQTFIPPILIEHMVRNRMMQSRVAAASSATG